MKNEKITTEGMQDKFHEVAGAFYEFVEQNHDFKNNNLELILILNKILSNLQKACLLWSQAFFNEAIIILRSAFESLVLFEYLVYFPSKIIELKEDNIIASFKNIYGYYKRGYLKEDALKDSYNALPIAIQSKLNYLQKSSTGIITYDVKKLEKSLNSATSLGQQTRKMIAELEKTGDPNFKIIYDSQIRMYNIASQVAHSGLESLVNLIKIDIKDKKLLREIESFRRDSFVVLTCIVETLQAKFRYPKPKNLYEKMLLLSNYLKGI